MQQARAIGLAWHAILPLSRAEFAKDFTPGDWAAVEEVLAAADHVRTISEYGDRKDGYLDCGIETVNGADVLLAVWDGEPARGKGGTADVVQYAESIGKPVMIIDAATHEVRKENWDRLDPDDAVLADLNGLPDATTAWSENPVQGAGRRLPVPAEMRLSREPGRPAIPAPDRRHGRRTRRRVAHRRDGRGLRAAPARAALARAFLHHFCAVAALVLRRQMHSHHSWVRCRLAAEFCRSALATWGLPRAAPLLQDLDLAGVRGLTRSLYILHTRSSATRPVPIEEFKRIYLEKRIDDQLAYYDRQVSRALPLYRRLAAGFSIATVLALISTAFYAISLTLDLDVPAWIEGTTYVFLPIALPALAAAAISIISINDLQRRVARYREMKARLEASRAQVASCKTWNSLEHVVLRTERALLQEVIEWHSIRSFSASH